MSTANQTGTPIGELFVDHRFKDDWPTRVVDTIADLSKRHAARLTASNDIADEIAGFLMNWFKQHPLHVQEVGPIYHAAAGRAFCTIESSIDLESLCRDLTRAACERYPLADTP